VLYRLEEKPYKFASLQLAQTIIYLSLLVVFVVVLRMNAAGKILSTIVSFSLLATVHLILLAKRGYFRFPVKKKATVDLMKFGLPLLPHSLSFWFKSGFDKIIITSFCGLAINGIYSMALSFGALYTIFNNAFSNSYIPYLQKRISNFTPDTIDVEKKRLVLFSYKMMFGFALLSIIVIALCWLAIKYVLDPQYIDSFQFIPWIMIGLTFNSMYGLVIQFPYSVKKTLGLGVVTFSGSVVQLILTYLLVSNIGVDGVKISYVVGSFIIMMGVWIYSNKVYPMPWFSFVELSKK
jgi:O-antigen/teichoic acid export membrane protein